MTKVFGFTIALAVAFVVRLVMQQLHVQELENGNFYTDKQVDFIKWKVCVESSDGTDSDCEYCDAVYNPNGYDFRLDTVQTR